MSLTDGKDSVVSKLDFIGQDTFGLPLLRWKD
jgi:hypothetical protein